MATEQEIASDPHLFESSTDRPWLLAHLAALVILGGLLVGYEPVGGDPDRLYRPLKTELARSLRDGRLPFWSDRFGLGIPLVAESQVAAFYPLNPLLYRVLDVNTAYRGAMLFHYLATVAATFAYARRLNLTPWGSALAAVAFTFCGFQAIHSSHEPFYHAIAYLPLALLLAENYAASGRIAWLALLALAFAAQLFLGHFQIQMWTAGLVLLTGLWRVAGDGRRWTRLLGLAGALAAAGAIAAVQLVLTWDLAGEVGQTERSVAELAFYSFPPAHWVELALPRFFQGLVGGPEDTYWFKQQTTGYEAALYVGTIPLIFACVGCLALREGKMLNLWRWVVPTSLALATMPRWWPQGYAALLQLPGLGYFRCPARYTLLTSLGLSLLGGLGFDRTLGPRKFQVGLVLAIAILGGAIGAGMAWTSRSGLPSHPGSFGLPFGVAPALLSWSVGLICILAWRKGAIGGWGPFLVAAIELGLLYHTSTTKWGWSVKLPADSPILTELRAESPRPRVAGTLDNIPIRAGLSTASPYLGFTLPPPHPLLKQVIAGLLDRPNDPVLRRWLRRFGVTHLVVDRAVLANDGESVTARSDHALDRLAYRASGIPDDRTWRVVRLSSPFPEARVTTVSRIVPTRPVLIDQMSRSDALDQVFYLPDDAPRDDLTPRAAVARLIDWDGQTAIVEHDGGCDLVLARTYNPGWRASVDNRHEVVVHRADGGFQAIRIPGSGRTRVTLRYQPRWLRPALGVSVTAAALVFCVLLGSLWRMIRSTPSKLREEPDRKPSQ